jgi:O-antigen/teichoic acid export membrane protein
VHRIFHNRVVKNSAWIICERVVSSLSLAIVTIFAARYLGAEQYGTLNYGLTLVTLFLSVMRLGIDSIIVNELIKNKSNEGSLIGTSIVLRVIASCLSILSIGLILIIFNSQKELLIVIALIQSLVLIFQSLYVLDYWFQSRFASKYVSIAKITATVLVSAYSFFLLISHKNVLWFAASTVLSSLIIGFLLLLFYRKQGGQRMTYSFKTAKYILSKSHHFIIANIMVIIYVQIDKLLIGSTLGDFQLGIYSAALTICMVWVFLPDAIITSLRPSILNAKLKSNDLYLHRLKQLYFIIFWFSVIVSGIITLIAPTLVYYLFGESFAASVIIIQIAVWYVPFSILGSARSIWIVGENKGKYVKYYLLYGVVVNISLNLILLPIIGIVGAAIATVATEFVTCFIAPLFYRSTRQHTKITLEAIFYRL